jgi:hypothetical protein
VTKYQPPVKRVDRGRYHYYTDANNQRIPGVTTILDKGIPKPQLITWAANATAEGAIDNWDSLSDLPVAARLKALQNIRYEVTNTAKNKGTLIHGLADQIVQGQQVGDIPDNLRPYLENYVAFIDAWKLDPILVEVVIVNYTHGYAGTLDLIADITGISGERERWLLDIKTGEKGIYAETALQLAAYRAAEYYVDQNGDEQPMIGVEHCGAIHLTADDALLVPTVSDHEQLLMFRIAGKVADYDNDKDGLVLPPIRPPASGGPIPRIVWEGDQR